MFHSINKDAVTNQCIRLIESLVKFSEKRPVDEVLKTTVGLISILGNIFVLVILMEVTFLLIWVMIIFIVIKHLNLMRLRELNLLIKLKSINNIFINLLFRLDLFLFYF